MLTARNLGRKTPCVEVTATGGDDHVCVTPELGSRTGLAHWRNPGGLSTKADLGLLGSKAGTVRLGFLSPSQWFTS